MKFAANMDRDRKSIKNNDPGASQFDAMEKSYMKMQRRNTRFVGAIN